MLEGKVTGRGWKSSAQGPVSWGAFPGSQVQLEGPYLHPRVSRLPDVWAWCRGLQA